MRPLRLCGTRRRNISVLSSGFSTHSIRTDAQPLTFARTFSRQPAPPLSAGRLYHNKAACQERNLPLIEPVETSILVYCISDQDDILLVPLTWLLLLLSQVYFLLRASLFCFRSRARLLSAAASGVARRASLYQFAACNVNCSARSTRFSSQRGSSCLRSTRDGFFIYSSARSTLASPMLLLLPMLMLSSLVAALFRRGFRALSDRRVASEAPSDG